MTMVMLRLLAMAVVALATSGCSEPAPRPIPSPVSAQPPRPAVAGGPRLYVTNERSGDLSVIDVGTRQVVATVPLGKRPRGVRVSPDGTVLYVALSGYRGRAEDRDRLDGTRAYVTCENGHSVAVVDARRHRVLTTIALEGENARPMGAVSAPDGKLGARFEQNLVAFLDLVEAAKHYPCMKKAWVEFLGEPGDGGGRVDAA